MRIGTVRILGRVDVCIVRPLSAKLALAGHGVAL
jgi:hypothetical protein